jgi:hypothetical protein
MEHARFVEHLRRAAELAVTVARKLVLQTLPDSMAYGVYPNQSNDGHPREGDEVIFPNDSLRGLEDYHGPWSEEQVVAFLWREGKIPEWIDVSVEAVARTRTLVALRCCGRFTANDGLHYYNDPGGVPPFGIKSPDLPPRWVSVEESGRFDPH